MIKNKKFVDSVLSSLGSAFNFSGELKYYPGRTLEESSSKTFETEKQYMSFLRKNVPLNSEFIFLAKSTKEIGFRLTDEHIEFKQLLDGTFTLSTYHDPTITPYKAEPPEPDLIRKELTALIRELSSGGKSPKKIAS